MAVKVDHPVHDGTTGYGDYRGRRTHIIRLLRDAKEPLTVDQVAGQVGLPANATRLYLESLVDAGLAIRDVQTRTTPGRPKVAYMGTLPNQTHERAQGYRLLAEIMAVAVATTNKDTGEWMYMVGTQWGRAITPRGESSDAVDEEEITRRLTDKLDALWFAPEVRAGEPPILILYNCPFFESTARFSPSICQLHAGMINGTLDELKSGYRLVRLRPHAPGHKCEGRLARTRVRMAKVVLEGCPNPAAQSGT